MTVQSKLESHIAAITSLGAAAIGLYALYYVKVGVPAIAVETVRDGVIEVAKTAWNEVKDRTYFLTSTMPGITLSSITIAVLSHIVYLQTNSRTAHIIEIFFGVVGVFTWASQHFIRREWPVFRVPLPSDNSTVATRSGMDIVPFNEIITDDIRAILNGSKNITEFITLMFVYLCKDMTVIMLNSNVLVLTEDDEGTGSLRLIQYGNNVAIQIWIPKMHEYITFIDTGNMEATASIFREFQGQLSPSSEVQKRVVERTEQMAVYDKPRSVIKSPVSWY